MRDGQCPKCGCTDVIPNVSVMDHTAALAWENLSAVVEENPNAWLFTGQVKTSLKAWVCGACGYTELYATNPATLLAAYRKHDDQS